MSSSVARVAATPRAALLLQHARYDGFGNRWNQTIQSGKAGVPSALTFDETRNRITSQYWSYDANGNTSGMPQTSDLAYDVDNRLLTITREGSSEAYGYLADNKRFWKSAAGVESYYLYGVGGQRILSYSATFSGGALTLGSSPKMDVVFAGRVIRTNGVAVVMDRLGSVVTRSTGAGTVSNHRYYPYGEEIEATVGDRNKFGTYHRDQTGLDYADQRNYDSSTGRFMISDPKAILKGGPTPGSWHRYTYTNDDPINYKDRRGLEAEGPEQDWCEYTDRFEPVGLCIPEALPIAPIPPHVRGTVCNVYLSSRPVLGDTIGGPRHTAVVVETAREYSDGTIVSGIDAADVVFDAGPQVVGVVSPWPFAIHTQVNVIQAGATPDGRYENARRVHGARVEWESGFSNANCLQHAFTDISARVTSSNSLYLVATSNSNSFTARLLRAGGFRVSQPPWAWGWGDDFVPLPFGFRIIFRGVIN